VRLSRYRARVSSPYLTVQEVAELARCEHRTVRRAIKKGELGASLIGGRWIVKDTAVDEWIDGCANERRPHAAPAPRRPPFKPARSASPARAGSIADLEAIRERMLSP
jgi:excisionase family DNA binding protein